MNPEDLSRNKFIPEKGKVLFFFGQDKITIGEYIRSFGTVPGGFTLYTSVQDAGGLESPVDHGGGIQDGMSLIENYPDSAIQLGIYMVGALDDVTAGKYDRNIDRIGSWIARSKRPVYVRIGYEFDFPQNRYEPGKYVAAYRYIADRWRDHRVDNLACVWHSYADASEIPAANWYPGDEYVDWCAISYFANSTLLMDVIADFARDRGKPLMIAEATPYRIGVMRGEESWNAWFKGVFEYIRTRDVKAFCYIGCDWEKLAMFAGQGWRDARVQEDAVVRGNWVKEIYGKEFLHASKGLFRELGYRKG